MKQTTLLQIFDGKVTLREFIGDKGYILGLKTSPLERSTLSKKESAILMLSYKELFDEAPENVTELRDKGLQSIIRQLKGVKYPTLGEKRVKSALAELINSKDNYRSEIDQYL